MQKIPSCGGGRVSGGRGHERSVDWSLRTLTSYLVFCMATVSVIDSDCCNLRNMYLVSRLWKRLLRNYVPCLQLLYISESIKRNRKHLSYQLAFGCPRYNIIWDCHYTSTVGGASIVVATSERPSSYTSSSTAWSSHWIDRVVSPARIVESRSMTIHMTNTLTLDVSARILLTSTDRFPSSGPQLNDPLVNLNNVKRGHAITRTVEFAHDLHAPPYHG